MPTAALVPNSHLSAPCPHPRTQCAAREHASDHPGDEIQRIITHAAISYPYQYAANFITRHFEKAMVAGDVPMQSLREGITYVFRAIKIGGM